MFNNDTLRDLTLEILKSRCDLKNTSEDEILKSYFNIWIELKRTDKTLKADESIKVLK